MSYRGGRGRGGDGFRGGDGGFRGGSGGRGGGPPRGRGDYGGGGPPGRGRGDYGDRGRGGPPGRGRGAPSGPIIFSPPGAQSTVPNELMASGNALIQTLSTLPPTGGQGPKPPVRPGYGTRGVAITLRANHFALKVPKGPFFEYRVSFEPAVTIRRVRKRLLEILENAADFQKFKNFIAHDSSEKLIASARLPQPNLNPLTFTVKLFDDDEDKASPNAKTYVISISFIKEINIGNLNQFLNGTDRSFEVEPLIAALNILLGKHAASAGGVKVGRERFFFKTPNTPSFNLGAGLEAWKGFFTSVRPTVNSLMVNFNVCFTAFYIPGSLINAIDVFRRESMGGNPERFVQGLRVSPGHLAYKPKKTIKKLLLGDAAYTRTFKCEEYGKVISVAEYFKKKYNVNIPQDKAYLVDLGTKEKSNLVPAIVCEILPNQSFKGKLSDGHTAEMIKYACNRPADNARSIVGDGLALMGLPGTQTMKNFGVSMNGDMVVVPARVLPPPRLLFGKNKSPNIMPDKASWNLRDLQFLRGARLDNWGLLVIMFNQSAVFKGPNDPALENIIMQCKAVFTASGLTTSNPKAVEPVMTAVSNPDMPSQLKAKIQSLASRKVNFILVVLPDKNKRVYATVRRICDVEVGIHATCMVTEKVIRTQPQYLANVALKINPKLGGINYALDANSSQWLTKEVTMLVGMDVTHPGPGSMKGTPSIAGVVASYDEHHTLFSASLRLQTSKQEMIDDLAKMMEERILHFHKSRRVLPQRVIVFRDGVSEGQFVTVLEAEYPKLMEAFRRASSLAPSKKYRPKLTVVICGKRHNTRFYPTEEKFGDHLGNPKPGTVVDRGITAIYEFDFFLQAHSGLQGQTRPTHYTVVYDENAFDADAAQSIINYSSYTFARATRAVGLVPPAYYADLLCERGRCYIQDLLVNDSGSSNYGDEASVYEAAVKAWGAGVHPNVATTMFYL